MSNRKAIILAINPGTKYLGLAVFVGTDLRLWEIKVFKGKWSKEKLGRLTKAVESLMDQFEAEALALKRLHPSRSSRNLNELVFELRNVAWKRGASIQEYSIKELERCFTPGKKTTRAALAEAVVAEYPALWNEWEKERNHKNPYYFRLFEAVAMGAACSKSLERTS